MKNSKKLLSHTQAVVLFIVLTVTFNVLGLKINGIIRQTDIISDYIPYGSKILGFILLVEMVLSVYFSPMKFNSKALRFSLKEDRKSFIDSCLISLVIIAGLLGFRFYMNMKNPVYREIPAFGLYLNMNTRWLYPINIVFQEFFIKAFTQENIGIMLNGINTNEKQDRSKRGKVFLTTLITSLFFFVLHVQYRLYYMIGAFILCFITGLLYERDRNIWGAVMVHIALGFLPRCFGVLQIIEG